MIQISTHPMVRAIAQIPEQNFNQSQMHYLHLVKEITPETPAIDQLLQDENSFTGLSDVKDFTRIDIDIKDWIRKIRKG